MLPFLLLNQLCKVSLYGNQAQPGESPVKKAMSLYVISIFQFTYLYVIIFAYFNMSVVISKKIKCTSFGSSNWYILHWFVISWNLIINLLKHLYCNSW